MQKLCCVRTRQHPLPVWSHKFVLSSTTHISTNSHPFLVGIVSHPNIHLTPRSVTDQNLTCSTPSSLSSFCRIPFILCKLKIELTKNHFRHAGKNGEHHCRENLHDGVENGEHSCGENFHRNSTKRHIKSHHTRQSLNTHVHLMTTNTWTPLMYPASMKREHPNVDPASQNLTGVA